MASECKVCLLKPVAVGSKRDSASLETSRLATSVWQSVPCNPVHPELMMKSAYDAS